MKLILAITAASGGIYARQILELAIADKDVESVAVILSSNTAEVLDYEGITLPHHPKVEHFDNQNMFASPASGSAKWDAMIIAPCSVGTLARVAHGTSESLITRSADVMLKERRPLVLVLRETPLSLIHLRNMTQLSEAGAVIFPASPSFYTKSQDIEELTLNLSARIADFVGIKTNLQRWEGKNK